MRRLERNCLLRYLSYSDKYSVWRTYLMKYKQIHLNYNYTLVNSFPREILGQFVSSNFSHGFELLTCTYVWQSGIFLDELISICVFSCNWRQWSWDYEVIDVFWVMSILGPVFYSCCFYVVFVTARLSISLLKAKESRFVNAVLEMSNGILAKSYH
mgnify:CR=1 FL=1